MQLVIPPAWLGGLLMAIYSLCIMESVVAGPDCQVFDRSKLSALKLTLTKTKFMLAAAWVFVNYIFIFVIFLLCLYARRVRPRKRIIANCCLRRRHFVSFFVWHQDQQSTVWWHKHGALPSGATDAHSHTMIAHWPFTELIKVSHCMWWNKLYLFCMRNATNANSNTVINNTLNLNWSRHSTGIEPVMGIVAQQNKNASWNHH